MLRRVLGAALVLAAVLLVGVKARLDRGGPYLEALPPYPYCADAEAALAAGRHLDAIELAEAGGCEDALTAARAEWNSLAALLERCVGGVWTGRAERSEEHTSELQSRENLVCRLLPENKMSPQPC